MATIFQIEKGVLGLAIVGDTDPATWMAPTGKTVDTAVIGDYTGQAGLGGDFSCQITGGSLEASPNVSSIDTPATFCSPAESKPQVGLTSYTLNVNGLQDPNVVNGISRFLFEHDAEEAYFFLGLDGTNPPKAIGRVRLVAGTIGGDARTTLTFSLSLPVDGKPSVLFGDATTNEVVDNRQKVAPTDVVADAAIGAATGDPAKVLIAAAKYIGNPKTAWTTGQQATLGGWACHWTGSTWAAGAA